MCIRDSFNSPRSRLNLETAYFAQLDTIAPPPASASGDASPAAASATTGAETPPQDDDTDDGTRSPMVCFDLVLGCHPWLFLVGGRPHRLRPHAPGWHSQCGEDARSRGSVGERRGCGSHANQLSAYTAEASKAAEPSPWKLLASVVESAVSVDSAVSRKRSAADIAATPWILLDDYESDRKPRHRYNHRPRVRCPLMHRPPCTLVAFIEVAKRSQ